MKTEQLGPYTLSWPEGVFPLGGDALVEIAFDNVGTKRLMLKSAAAHMEKI